MKSMTSEYDMLMSIYYRALENSKLRPIAEWLFDICIEQANNAKKGWNYEIWKSRRGEIYTDDFERKAHFLDECHCVLAHHGINAFDVETYNLIDIVFDVVNGRDVCQVNKIQKRFPKLPEFLKSLGYKPLDKKGWMWSKS